MRKGEFSVFVTKEGKTVEYHYPVSRLDELISRADAAFLPKLTPTEMAAEDARFRQIVANDRERRHPTVKAKRR